VHEYHALPAARPLTVLGRLQQAVADDAEPSTLVPQPLSDEDFSVQVHACHGLPRQVEVLRELLVGMLADDPTLEPRDLVVMCPDVEAVVPLVSAAFGRSSAADQPLGHPGQRIRVKVADRSLLQVNSLLGLLDELLGLADARCTLDEVLGLLALAPVRRRFGLSDDDLELLGRWLPDVGVRWGLDGEHRARHGLPGVDEHTWQAGLDRLLLGVAVSEDGLPLVGGVLPYDAVASQQAELVGRLAEAVERLRRVLGRLRDPQSLAEWVSALEQGLALLAEVSPDDEWQDAAARRTLAEVLADAGDAASTVLTLPDVRALLRDRLAGRPTRANFRTGDLTVCSLAPMRSVPHRVVVLLGLDDDAYPRTGGVRGDDVLRRRPFVGDRDVRSEDRQILLDAIHAATERLLVLYTGMNPRTNAHEPPAVPVGELIDTLYALVDERDRGRLQVRHPLQPFDERALVTSGDARPVASAVRRPFSFDPAMLGTAQAARGEQHAPVRLCEVRLPPLEPVPPVVEIRDLVQMLENPAKGWLRQRLDVALPDELRADPTRLTEPLTGLQAWQVGDRLLQQRMSGWGGASVAAERARGALPVTPVADALLADAQADIAAVADAALRARYPDAQSRHVVASVGGRAVAGSARVVMTADGRQGAVVLVSPSKPKAAHLLRVWVPQLALTVAQPEVRWSSRVVDRGPAVALPAVDPALAARVLAQLLDVHALGLRCALPLTAAAGSAFAHSELAHPSADAERDARWAFRDDARDGSLQRVWGPHVTLDQLFAAQPPDDLRLSSDSWFATLARTVWAPVHEARLAAVAS
jgi:exodeoxyribonuclease V gamma subunit